ncbi:hypothetical protein [Amycolatopsis jiangsuensis]|uniref:Flagellar biosynthesis GTPase FlhF n=1 Tax=Amycolatopsis jiangsuensis TaxID=1181879 RepID=A0A840J5C1_9PSEU|nr:hypothetical protein [Amycolatopsis jiangsuensis]MBB4688919.1 flagellar biosynthesis GTPase FlhF [Amycolatopsis jiangsuensis]
MATSDFDTVADRLYAGDPADFVAERTAAARAAGDAGLARRIRGLRKPTAAAAFVNHLAWKDSAPLRELAELGEQLREAHEHLAGPRLRELAHRRAELVRRIMGEAHGLSESVAREVEDTLEAVVAGPDVARLALAGRLTSKANQNADQWLSLPVKESSRPRPSAKDKAGTEKAGPGKGRADKSAAGKAGSDKPASGKSAADKSVAEKARAEKRRAEQQREREERRRRETEARKARATAERDLVRAQRVAEQANARVTEVRKRLTEAEDRAARAAEELATAREAFEKADQAAENPG